MDIITIPFAWLLRVLYSLVNNYGVAIIIFAVIVKLIMLPFQMKSKRGTMRTSRLQPQMKELEKKYGDNKQKYQEEVQKLYKEEGANPMSGCLWSLIPFPIMIALYTVIRQPLSKLMQLTAEQIEIVTNKLVELGAYTIPEKVDAYYEIKLADLVHQNFDSIKSLVPDVMDLDFSFLGLNLGNTPQWKLWEIDWANIELWPVLGLFLLPLLSAGLAFLQMKVSNATMPQQNEAQGNMKNMMLMMPLMSLWIGFMFPAALSVYWLVGNILSIFQDMWLNKRYSKIMDAEDAERNERYRLREEELERKRLETERLKLEGAQTRNVNTSKKKLQTEKRSKQEQRIAAEKAVGRKPEDKPDSQVGSRRYARGRAYVEDRFINPEDAEELTRLAAEESEGQDSIDSDEPDELMIPALEEHADTAQSEDDGDEEDDYPDEDDDEDDEDDTPEYEDSEDDAE